MLEIIEKISLLCKISQKKRNYTFCIMIVIFLEIILTAIISTFFIFYKKDVDVWFVVKAVLMINIWFISIYLMTKTLIIFDKINEASHKISQIDGNIEVLKKIKAKIDKEKKQEEK